MGTRTVQLDELIAPTVEALGFELWGLELIGRGGNSTLRVFIDHEKGISLDGCQLVSKQVSALLDVEDPIRGRYNLEVSSPGVERPLFKREHYAKFIGQLVKVNLRLPIDGRRKVTGTIVAVEKECVKVQEGEHDITLRFADIAKGRLLINSNFIG